jgi:hypothetical protein
MRSVLRKGFMQILQSVVFGRVNTYEVPGLAVPDFESLGLLGGGLLAHATQLYDSGLRESTSASGTGRDSSCHTADYFRGARLVPTIVIDVVVTGTFELWLQ